MIARLALKNAWRSPRRTALTTTAIVAGVWLSILGKGFVAGTNESIIVAATDDTVGHVMARPADYPTQGLQHPVDRLLEVNDEVRRLLDQEAVAWTGRTYFAPIAAHGRDSLRVVGIAFDEARDEQVFPRTHWRVEGALPVAENEVAVSPRVARLLRVSPGDPLVLQARTHRGAMNALTVQVSAIVRTGNPALDNLGLFAPQALSRQLLVAESPTHLSVKLRNRASSEAFAAKLSAGLGGGAEVVTWQSETAELLALQEIRVQSINMVVFILLALAGLGIANTILMAAHERVREVGTLRSMGMTEGGVIRLFLLEGALIGVVGGVIGALLGGGLVAHWAKNPIDLSEMIEQQGGSYSMSSLIYTQFDLTTTLAAVAMGIVVAVVASFYPARVASRMVPAEAVRAL